MIRSRVELRASSARRSRRALVVTVLPLALAACRGASLQEDDAGGLLRAVPVPLSATASDADLPAELRVDAGDQVIRQSYTIGLDGRFTFTRSVERRVGSLGIRAADVSRDEAAALGAPPLAGVVVRSLHAGGAGQTAGLLVGDVITGFDAREVLSFDQLESLVREARPDAVVAVDIIRAGERRQVPVRIGGNDIVVGARALTRPLETIDDSRHTGLVLAEIPGDIRPLVLGTTRPEPGLLVIGMVAGSPAFFTDLRHRDYVFEIDDRPVGTIAELAAVLRGLSVGDAITVRAWRGDRLIEARLRPSKDATAKYSVDILGILRVDRAPAKREFSLLWSLFWSSETRFEIAERNERTFHETESGWSLLLGIIRYDASPERTALRVLWVLPLEFSRERR